MLELCFNLIRKRVHLLLLNSVPRVSSNPFRALKWEKSSLIGVSSFINLDFKIIVRFFCPSVPGWSRFKSTALPCVRIGAEMLGYFILSSTLKKLFWPMPHESICMRFYIRKLRRTRQISVWKLEEGELIRNWLSFFYLYIINKWPNRLSTFNRSFNVLTFHIVCYNLKGCINYLRLFSKK